jgi:tetratricopeptide (TPR) repeat protein
MFFRSETPARIAGYRPRRVKGRDVGSENANFFSRIKRSALYILLAAATLSLVLICAGLIVRYVAPSEIINVQPFNVPGDFQQHTVTGVSVASIFADQMEQIFKDGRLLWDKPRTESVRNGSEIILATNSIPWSLKVEYKGLSFNLSAAWQKLTSKTFEITGDLVSEKSGIVLHARIRGPEAHARFTAISKVGPYTLDSAGPDVIDKACNELALSLISDFAPPVAATYQLNHERPDIAEKVVTQWLPRESNSYDPYLMLGIILDRTGRSEEAISNLQTALTKSSEPDHLFRIHNSLGSAYFNLKNYDQALSEYLLSAKLAPRNAIPSINIAGVYSAKGQFAEAVRIYDELVDRFPNDPFIRYNFGTTLLESKDDGMLDRAITHLSAAIQLRPNDGRAFNNLASALYDKGDIDNALRKMQVAVQLEPHNESFNKHLLFLQSEKRRQTGAPLKRSD